jgi:hypothetical protein
LQRVNDRGKKRKDKKTRSEVSEAGRKERGWEREKV